MSKKRIKELQNIAANLPVMFEVVYHRETISGAELLHRGIEDLKDGTPVNKKQRYVEKTPKPKK